MAKSEITTVAEYLAGLPDERRATLSAVLAVVRENLPGGYAEGINWGMIAFEVPLDRYPSTYNKRPLAYAALAAQKNHFAPVPQLRRGRVGSGSGAPGCFRGGR